MNVNVNVNRQRDRDFDAILGCRVVTAYSEASQVTLLGQIVTLFKVKLCYYLDTNFVN